MNAATTGIRLFCIAGFCLCVAGGEQSQAAYANDAIDMTAEAPAVWSQARMLEASPENLPILDSLDAFLAGPVPRVGPSVAEEAVDHRPEPSAAEAAGNPSSKPLKWAGKVFMKRDDKNSWCSAQLIAPRIVLTAAHCVRAANTGKWRTDFTFALQYHQGRFTKQYRVQCLATKGAWVQKGRRTADIDYRWDYALLLVTEDSITGHFGWHVNWRGKYNRAVKIGYPEDIDRGRVVQVEHGPLSFPQKYPGLVELRHGNPKNSGGSSGGAFVGNYSSRDLTNINYVISVNSFSTKRVPGVGYGPYLDSEFTSLVEFVKRGCR